jgi:hypothetical protein
VTWNIFLTETFYLSCLHVFFIFLEAISTRAQILHVSLIINTPIGLYFTPMATVERRGRLQGPSGSLLHIFFPKMPL